MAGLEQIDRSKQEAISTGNFVGAIFTKIFYVGVIAPFLFAYLGKSNVLTSFDVQSRWLVSKVAWVWPVLPVQYELVRQVQGVGQSVSYALMCTVLWAWPVICAIAYLRAHMKCQREILPILPKEIGAIVIVIPIAVLVLVFDVTRIDNPLFGFPVQYGTLLYVRQWFVFAPTAFVLGFLLYVLGRSALWTWKRSG